VSEQSTWTSPSQLGFNYGSTYNWLFGYDLVGNPTTFRGNADSFNADNQSNSLAYDGNGNPTTLFGSRRRSTPKTG
jgi:hypothetical protein